MSLNRVAVCRSIVLRLYTLPGLCLAYRHNIFLNTSYVTILGL
jgi:hypothetical protein